MAESTQPNSSERHDAACPRGCVDTDGCGCEWNAPNERAEIAAHREKMIDAINTDAKIRAALDVLDGAGVAMEDTRLKYVEIQVDREAWHRWQEVSA